MKVWLIFKGAEEDSWIISVHREENTAKAAMEQAQAEERTKVGPKGILHGYWLDEQEVLP